MAGKTNTSGNDYGRDMSVVFREPKYVEMNDDEFEAAVEALAYVIASWLATPAGGIQRLTP